MGEEAKFVGVEFHQGNQLVAHPAVFRAQLGQRHIVHRLTVGAWEEGVYTVKPICTITNDPQCYESCGQIGSTRGFYLADMGHSPRLRQKPRRVGQPLVELPTQAKSRLELATRRGKHSTGECSGRF